METLLCMMGFCRLKKTENSLIERMALLPRFMEANGLDANKFIIERLRKEGKEEIIALWKLF